MPDEMAPVFARHLKGGRLWSAPDAPEAVLPTGIVRPLFGIPETDEPDLARVLGRRIRISPLRPASLLLGTGPAARGNDPELTVVGVYRGAAFAHEGIHVLLPHATGRKVFEGMLAAGGFTGFFGPIGAGQFPELTVKTADAAAVDAVLVRLRERGFQTLSTRDLVQSIQRTFLVAEIALAGVGGIGLLVAFFGIMNTMFMAVLERTREIGVLKALGARAREVRRLFLVESALIGLAGALAGIAGGRLLGGAIDLAAHRRFPDLPADTALFEYPAWLVLGLLGFAVAVSAAAGLLPAARAARLDPVAALRQ